MCTRKISSAILTILLGAAFLTSCSTPFGLATRDLKVAVAQARVDCMRQGESSQELCDRVIQRQLDGHAVYFKNRVAAATSARTRHAELATRAHAALDRCRDNVKSSCETAATYAQEARRAQFAHHAAASAGRAVTADVYRAIGDIAAVVAEHNAAPQVICRVHDLGWVDCMLIETMLASYDAEMQILILEDIQRLYEIFDLDMEQGLLLGCAPGVWGAEHTSVLGGGSLPEMSVIDESVAADLANRCAELNTAVGNMSPSPGGATGFSGVTGFDPMGLISACDMNVGASDMGEFIADAMEMHESATQQCETSIAESMMSEPSSAEDEKAKNPPTKGEPDGPSDDATVVSETNEEGENEQGQGTTTTTRTYSDNTVVKATTNQVTGTTTVDVTYTDVPGASATMVIDPSNGGSKTYSDSDDPGVTTTVSDGQPDYSYTKDGEGNSWVDAPGHTLYENRWGEARWYDKDTDQVRCLICTGQWATCVDETCGSCRDFSQFMPDMMGDCLDTGGAGYSCGRYSAGSACCSNPNAYPGEPRVLMPNPEGDFACAGAIDADIQTGVCQERCSVANHEDCESNCLSASGLRVDFDPLVAICRYAIWDACFSGPTIVLPGGGGRSPSPPPAPTLDIITLDHMLFLPIDDRFGPEQPDSP